MQRVKASKTQKFLHGLREVSPTANPMPDPVQVEGNQFFSTAIGQWVVGAQLLHEAAVPGTLVVRGHDAVEGSVGAAAQRQADGQVASTESCCPLSEMEEATLHACLCLGTLERILSTASGNG